MQVVQVVQVVQVWALLPFDQLRGETQIQRGIFGGVEEYTQA